MTSCRIGEQLHERGEIIIINVIAVILLFQLSFACSPTFYFLLLCFHFDLKISAKCILGLSFILFLSKLSHGPRFCSQFQSLNIPPFHIRLARLKLTYFSLISESLAHRRNVATLRLFYRYYFGRCSSELAQQVRFPYSRGRSTRCSDIFLSPFLDVTRMSI